MKNCFRALSGARRLTSCFFFPPARQRCTAPRRTRRSTAPSPRRRAATSTAWCAGPATAATGSSATARPPAAARRSATTPGTRTSPRVKVGVAGKPGCDFERTKAPRQDVLHSEGLQGLQLESGSQWSRFGNSVFCYLGSSDLSRFHFVLFFFFLKKHWI